MRRFEVGDRVRVDIPDTDDPDFDRFHGHHGTMVDIIKDDAGHEPGTNMIRICLLLSSTMVRPTGSGGEIFVPNRLPEW